VDERNNDAPDTDRYGQSKSWENGRGSVSLLSDEKMSNIRSYLDKVESEARLGDMDQVGDYFKLFYHY